MFYKLTPDSYRDQLFNYLLERSAKIQKKIIFAEMLTFENVE